MRILGCLDGTNAEQIGRAAQMFSATPAPAFGLLTVIDIGPREDIDRMRGRFLRAPMRHQPVTQEMLAAEAAAAQDILSAGLTCVQGAETLVRQGRPELEIVNAAAEWKADVILICPSAEFGEPPRLGPRFMGHIARFVLDHAPCPVLLVRQLAREQFPIER
jgi:nucleotide-binding universal stress UspA family protein